MAAAYIKSVIYLGVAGGVGYVLMRLTTPNEDKRRLIAESAAKQTNSEILSKKEKFLKKLQEAQSDTPIYLKKTEETKPSKREIN